MYNIYIYGSLPGSLFPNHMRSDLVRALCVSISHKVKTYRTYPCAFWLFLTLCADGLVRALCVPCAYLVRIWCIRRCAHPCPCTRWV